MHFASLALRDTLVTFLVTWLAYTLARPFYRMRTAIWTAFLYTVLVHTEPMFLVLFPVLAVFLALKATHHRALSTQYVFLFLTALCVFFVPWTARNVIVYRDVIPVSLEATRYTGPVLRILRDEPATTETDAPGAIHIERPGFFDNQREFWRMMRLYDSPADPARGVPAEPAWSLRHNLATMLNYGILLPFFLAGSAFAFVRRHRAALVLASMVWSYAIVRGFVGATEASRVWVEPCIVLVAVFGAKVLLDLRRAAGETSGNVDS
jgi:hypothetical protein